MGLLERLFRGVRREAMAAVPEGAVLREAHVVGQGLAGGGPGTMRGNGHLVLTGDELVFVLAVPRRTLRIPRGAVLGVDVTRRHARQASSRRWVRVRFLRDDGREDAFAFDPIRDGPDPWLAALGGVDEAGW